MTSLGDTEGDRDDELVTAPRGRPKPIDRPVPTREVTESNPVPEAGHANAILAVARTQPFMRNFIRCAHDRYPKRANPETRVANMITDHPRWYRFCFWADQCVVALAVIALAVFSGLALWKTFIA